jgi:hypothetical protein
MAWVSHRSGRAASSERRAGVRQRWPPGRMAPVEPIVDGRDNVAPLRVCRRSQLSQAAAMNRSKRNPRRSRSG